MRVRCRSSAFTLARPHESPCSVGVGRIFPVVGRVFHVPSCLSRLSAASPPLFQSSSVRDSPTSPTKPTLERKLSYLFTRLIRFLLLAKPSFQKTRAINVVFAVVMVRNAMAVREAWVRHLARLPVAGICRWFARARSGKTVFHRRHSR